MHLYFLVEAVVKCVQAGLFWDLVLLLCSTCSLFGNAHSPAGTISHSFCHISP